MTRIPITTSSRFTTAAKRNTMRRLIIILCANLAVMLARGSAPAQDSASISDLKVRAAAGDKTATRQLAEAYYIGKGVDQDFKQAAQWYNKAAMRGHIQAQHNLGLLYYEGRGVAIR